MGRTLIMTRRSAAAPQPSGLNPQETSPFYVFLDQRLSVQACNGAGDENWLSFIEQICGPPGAGLEDMAGTRPEDIVAPPGAMPGGTRIVP